MRRTFVLALLCAVLLASAAAATTVAYVPVNRSVQLSDMVLVGYVLGTEAVYNHEGEIVTRVDVLVDEPLKGMAEAGRVVSFHAWGGSLDGVNVETVGEASYRPGEKVLVQLEDIDGELHTLGLAFGKWNVVRDNAGASVLVRNLSDLNMVGVNEVPVERIPLDRMRRVVREAERLSF